VQLSQEISHQVSDRMPRRPRGLRLRRFFLLTAATTVIVGAMPALAEACTMTNTTTTKAFAQFGDGAQYGLAPSGSFESGAAGWSLSGSGVQTDNESFHIHAAGDTKALYISPTGVATSPSFCVSNVTPTFRLFARQTSGGWSWTTINVLWTDAAGVAHVTSAGGMSPNSFSWGASQVYPLGQMLPLSQAGSTLSVRLQFVPSPTGGGVAIDDLYVDPYRGS
jgi:hypothetical protein